GVTSVLRFHSHVVIRGITLGLMLALIPPLATTHGLSGAAIGLTLALLLTLPLYGLVIVKAWKAGGQSIALPQRDQRTTHRAAA
ncbi:MAG: hypothetical protein WBH86_13260, partial [Thermogutta sp.]